MPPASSRSPSSTPPAPLRVALLALPEAVLSTLAGLYDVMNAGALMETSDEPAASGATFRAEIVGERAGALVLASGVPLTVQRPIEEIESCDVVIVPSVLLHDGLWRRDRHPRAVQWLRRMHERGALLCSACSGIFLLAETGLYDGQDATVHFDYARAFAAVHPAVRIHPERVLVIAGRREELISSGASTTWHDLALYLIARFAGATEAQRVARMYALQWHHDGLAPYITFEGRRDHGDAEIEAAQRWLATHFSVASPVEEMISRSRLAERTFKRRFAAATGLTPIAYVQRLRVEDAKRRLERTDAAVDEIAWRVGYEDPAFFRRLFKRTTGLAPGAYRKRFCLPDFARPR
ncbi:MAG: helix-turn-helix domain-containing protein [Piscinibacter sp.]|nr:helix-turn-helix domain-containing protein [Piscinibacter sp.]